ncbi:MAG TPA: glycosyltransferase, partial [Anaerolineae bacterium]|nr:glycosyltransferase [Anaerolineae bacterium]
IERKGIDILLAAFVQEFTAQDDVALILKTAGYEHMLASFERKLAKLQRRRNAPEIVHFHEPSDSVAGYFTAADWGVFPFRGEGFGLPILECLACGRPVILTNGTAPPEFCNPASAHFIPATRVTRRGRQTLEPDRATLSKLLRAAYEGSLSHASPQAISASVADWTWERTAKLVDRALRAHAPSSFIPRAHSAARVGYAFYQKGVTSWKNVAKHVDAALAREFKYVPLNFHAAPPTDAFQVLLGDSGFALEPFVRAARANPAVKRILLRVSGPLETMLAVEARERQLCGVPPRRAEPMTYWRNQREIELADQIIIPSCVSEHLFLTVGYPAHKLHVLPLGIVAQPKVKTRRERTLRFLYIATNPFRKGIRILFQAWDALQPRHAELICIASNEALQSPLLLRYLVRNPTITFKPLMPRRQLRSEYENCDCQILPSFEDGFSFSVADGMGFGKPAILSADTGLSDLIVHLENGYLVPTGSVTPLKDALAYFCDNRRDVTKMGHAAYETARQYSWARFQRGLAELVQSHLDNA